METTVIRRLHAGLALVLLALPSARGAELVTLHSGFAITCTSREPISASRMRLYLLGASGTAINYIDVPQSSVAAVETVAEPPPSPASSSVPSASPAISGILQRSGAAHNVNVVLLASVINAESAGNTLAVSRTGARGLMQLMPGTARQFGVKESFQPSDNVNGGSAYLDQLLTRYHENIVLALAAYNAGPGAVDRFHGMPPFRETRLYVARVLREFNRRVQQDATRRAGNAATLAAASAQPGSSL